MAFEHEEALYRLGQLPSERLPSIAIAMLEAGFDSQAIRELAMLSEPSLRDGSQLFEQALEALNRAPLSERESIALVREQALRRISDGVVSPLQGASEMWSVWHMLGYPPDLAPFVYLTDMWDEYPDQHIQIADEIVQTARQLLNGKSSAAAI